MSWPDDSNPWQDPWGYQPPKKTSGLAIAALITATAGLLVCPLVSIIGFFLGIGALNEIGNSNGRLEGRGLAIAGMVIGGIALMLMVVLIATIGSVSIFSR